MRTKVRLGACAGLAILSACARGPLDPLPHERRVEVALAERAGVTPSTEPLALIAPEETPVVEPAEPEDPPMVETAGPDDAPAVEPEPPPDSAPRPAPPVADPPAPAPDPPPDARAAEEAARAQLAQAGLAVLARAGSADTVVATSLARNADLWRHLANLGVSAAAVASRWTPDGNVSRPERAFAQLVESLAPPDRSWEAGRAVESLAHRARGAYLRLQAALRALDLQSTHVRSFQAATALSRSDQAVTEHVGERAAAQRARLELVRLQTEVSSLRRELELVMGFPAGAPPWTPLPGPPALPPARQDPRLEDAIERALAARKDLADLRGRDDSESRARAAELELALRAHVIDAHARLTTARLVAEACRDALIPMHERIVELALDRFNAGSVDAAALLSAQRELVTARRQEIESLRDYWLARLDLRRAADD